MNKTSSGDASASTSKLALRQQAEEIIRVKVASTAKKTDTLLPDDVRKTLYELQVHQIELEMQNEELRHAQQQLDASRARYFDLFDLAPVGYCTVSEQGLIVEANIAAATLLGVARSELVGQCFSRFILTTFQDTFYLYRKRLSETRKSQTCELKMTPSDGQHIWVGLTMTESQSDMGTPLQRVVLIDITDTKIMAAAMQESEARYRDLLNQQVKTSPSY